MSATNVTFTRCHRVENALESDANIRHMLGPKEHTIYKPPNNTPVKFCAEVLGIAQAIKDQKLDINELTQRQITAIAIPLLIARQDGTPLPKFVLDAPVAEPEPPAPKPKVAVVKPKPKPKPKTKPKTKEKPKVKPPAAEKAAAHDGKPAKTPAPAPPPKGRIEAPQAEIGQTREQVAKLFNEPPLPAPNLETVAPGTKGQLPFVWGVGVNSLFRCALTLLEAHGMKDSDFYKRAEQLALDVDKVTVLPRQIHAKENSNSNSNSRNATA